MMNLILSYLVCIAMLLGGGAALPDQPETATVRTIRNLSITAGEDSVILTPELRLTTALGSEGGLMQSEVVDGERTLLPMSGELTGDAFRFRLSESGNIYTISDAALMELLELEDVQFIPQMTAYLNNYSALLSRAMTDADYAQQLSQTVLDLLINADGASVEDTTVELDSAQVPSRRMQLNFTPETALTLLEGLADCGIPELEGLLNSYVAMFGAAMGEEYTDIHAFTAALRDELMEEGISNESVLPMELVFTTQAPAHAAYTVNFDIEGTGKLELYVAQTSTDEKTDVEMTMSFDIFNGEDSSNQFDIRMSEHVDGPLNAPENVQLSLGFQGKSDYHMEYTDDGDDPATHVYTSSNIMDAALDLNIAVADGLENTTATLTAKGNNSYDYDGDVNAIESSTSIRLSADDRREDDGSVTTLVSMDFDDGDMPISISYELNCAAGMPLPVFADGQSYDLTEIFGEEENGAGSVALMADVLKLGSDAAALCANDSVLALMELLGVDPAELAEELETVDALADVDDYASYGGDMEIHLGEHDEGLEVYVDESEDGEDWSGDYVRIESLEAAAQVYAGAIPTFTLPDDLAADDGMVIENYLTMNYSSAAEERAAQLICVCSGTDDTAYYAYDGGALTPAEGMAQLGSIDGESAIHCISVSIGNDNFYFYLYGLSRNEAEAVLASIQF